MLYTERKAEAVIRQNLNRGKSILLLGARQTGKTTMIRHWGIPDISISFARNSEFQRYVRDPVQLERELEEQIKAFDKPPVIFIDEVQKIPEVLDTAQNLIDEQKAQFILTGSSARKLKRGKHINLLPGRVVVIQMTPLLFSELNSESLAELEIKQPLLDDLLLYGNLPGIYFEEEKNNKEQGLYSYVSTYLEEEIRAEALVRNVGAFSRFLEVAAGESGKRINLSQLSQDIGVSTHMLTEYFQILEDCMVAHRIDPITESQTKRRLIKSPKYIYFDLGVRRVCANEGVKLPQKTMADLFEQYIGLELLNNIHVHAPQMKLRYWRDSAGPEVDFVIEHTKQLVPIEVKWIDRPGKSDARHLVKFLNEYEQASQAYIICRTPRRYKIAENIMAIPWQESQELILQNL